MENISIRKGMIVSFKVHYDLEEQFEGAYEAIRPFNSNDVVKLYFEPRYYDDGTQIEKSDTEFVEWLIENGYIRHVHSILWDIQNLST